MALNEKQKKRLWYLLLAGVLLVGLLLRVWALGEYPPGLNQDEASEGYEAWALLHGGMDRNGNRFPALFVSWGSGQNVLYAWLSMPIIALFGLTPVTLRLTAAICGTLTLPVMYLLGYLLGGRKTGFLALTITALCPWHIMLSRWALEANLLPCFQLAGILLAVYAMKKPWALVGAAIVFALSLYAYGTAFLFLALFLPPAFAYLLWKGKLPWYVWLTAVCAFVLLALPICLTQLRNALGLESGSFLGITLPALVRVRQQSTTALGKPLSAYLANGKAFWEILKNQTDGFAYNAVPGHMFFQGFWLLAAFGLGYTVYRAIRRALRPGEALMLCAVFAVTVCAFVINPNLNRMNMVFLPALYYAAAGFAGLLELVPWQWCRYYLCALMAVLLIFSTALAGQQYTTTIRDKLESWFFASFGEAVAYADTLEKDAVYVTDSVNMPYIYVLFYTQTPPAEFLETVVYENPDEEFRRVESFGKWTFTNTPPANAVCVLYDSQAEGREILAQFGRFVVCGEVQP